jgi:hypothetical protein
MPSIFSDYDSSRMLAQQGCGQKLLSNDGRHTGDFRTGEKRHWGTLGDKGKIGRHKGDYGRQWETEGRHTGDNGRQWETFGGIKGDIRDCCIKTSERQHLTDKSHLYS